jgi:hypothetical protein
MNLSVDVLDTKKLTYCREENSCVTEISTARINLFGRLYDDACDCGFETYNSSKNTTVRWYFSETIHDGEVSCSKINLYKNDIIKTK